MLIVGRRSWIQVQALLFAVFHRLAASRISWACWTGVPGSPFRPQHPCDLTDPLLSLQHLTAVSVRAPLTRLEIERCRSARAAIWGRWVMERTCRCSGDGPEFLSHHLRHPTADPHVHFVEYERRDLVGGREDGLDGEHHPGQLAARGDPAERLQLLAGIRRRSEIPPHRRRWAQDEDRRAPAAASPRR